MFFFVTLLLYNERDCETRLVVLFLSLVIGITRRRFQFKILAIVSRPGLNNGVLITGLASFPCDDLYKDFLYSGRNANDTKLRHDRKGENNNVWPAAIEVTQQRLDKSLSARSLPLLNYRHLQKKIKIFRALCQMRFTLGELSVSYLYLRIIFRLHSPIAFSLCFRLNVERSPFSLPHLKRFILPSV